MPDSTHALRRFGALAFCYFVTLGLFNPYAPLWFQSMGLSTVLIGTIASLQSWTRVVGPYGWGWLGDHGTSRVYLIRIGAVGAFMGALGLNGVEQAIPVAVVTTLIFLANGAIPPLYEATLAHLLSRDGVMNTARYGRVRVWGSIGFIVAVLLFGWLLERIGIRYFPWLVAVVNALLFASALALPRVVEQTHTHEAAPPVLPLLRKPEVAWFFTSIALTVLAHTSLYAFFSLYLVSLGFSKAAVGALWAVALAVEIVFFWFQGRWFGRFAAERWLIGVGVVAVMRFTLLASAGAWSLVWLPILLSQLLHAVTFAGHHAACIVMIHRHFPERLRGRGQALYTVLGYGVPGVLGGFAGGWLIEQLGYAAVYWAAVLSASLATYAAWRAMRLA